MKMIFNNKKKIKLNKNKFPPNELWLLNNRLLILLILSLLLILIQSINCSQQSIYLDSNGSYHDIIIGFDNNFQSFEKQNINTTIISIMSQLQRTSLILNKLMSTQIADVTLILPGKWQIDINELQKSTSMQFDVRESKGQYRSLIDADILYTNDDKNQILTMQYGDCGEGGMAINFPMQYISDEYSPRLLAHQWILYRYGVFNEFGFEDDYNYPVYYTSPDGELHKNNKSKIQPNINSCYQGSNVQFKYSNNCNNETDPNTGRPINPNCDVIPTKNTITSSFMYAPISVSEYHLCNSTTHNYQSPTKHNIICDYQSIQDVITKHYDFERYKPRFDNQNIDLNMSTPLIRFQILQNKNDLNNEHSIKANVLYALPKYGSKFLEASMDTIKKIGYFSHLASFTLYEEDQLHTITSWRPSSQLSMIYFDDNNQSIKKLKLRKIFEQITKEFDNVLGGSGTCVFFYSGDMQLENTSIDYIESLADLFNRKNLRLQIIIYNHQPSNDVLRFFDQLKSKIISYSSVDYAFSRIDQSSSSIMAFRTQLTSIINSILFNLLQDITDQSHLIIKRETIRSDDKSGIEFYIDKTIDENNLLIEMTTNGTGSELAMNFNLIDNYHNNNNNNNNNQIIKFQTFEIYNNTVIIYYDRIKSGKYHFNYHYTDLNTFITITVRVLSKKNSYSSYKDALLSARCWIQQSRTNPLRGYVHVSKGLNGPLYDADVSFAVRAFTRTQQRQEMTRPSNDNGRGNPDITAHDGIYSAYLDSLMFDNSESYGVAYTVVAKIIGNKMAIKPGNFGNTVMFNSKTRCCGTEVKTNDDYVIESNTFERIVHCGSYYNSMQNENHHSIANYVIRDLRIIHFDSDNRTITLEWSSPFYYSNDRNKPIIIKAFHSYDQHSKLPLEIKQSFDREQNEAEIEVINDNKDDIYSQSNINNNNNNEQESDIIFETLTSSSTLSTSSSTSSQGPYARYEPSLSSSSSYYQQPFRSSLLISNTVVTNSLRQIKIHILSPEEGFYMIAVKERNDDNESKPSNIVTVYLKSNVIIENITALANDNSRLSAGPNKENGRGRTIPWIQILIICIASAFVLFIIILFIICLTIRRYRRTNKDMIENDYKKSSDNISNANNGGISSALMNGNLMKNDTTNNKHLMNNKQTYYHTQDGNSIISNSINDNRIIPNNNDSNHTSCSSVNTTVDNGNSYLDHQQNHLLPNSIDRQQQQQSDRISIEQSTGVLKELNVASLMPNSWDAKELLEHWGRVQEAKLRQESPNNNNGQSVMNSNSPSVLSYGGSSSIDNYHNNQSNHHHHNNHVNISYNCQPAIVQPTTNGMHYGNSLQNDYSFLNDQQQQQQQSPSSMYSPYSNASSIWQHQKQLQQQQQQQQQLQHHQHSYLSLPSPPPPPLSNNNLDDNGLPEYSVVRKIISANISQV